MHGLVMGAGQVLQEEHGWTYGLLAPAGKRAKLWTTFNEPGVAAICGHIVGNHPPGKLLHFRVSQTACVHVTILWWDDRLSKYHPAL